jgi:glycosyltransferase involved in cell wall biosynthesis
MHVVIYTHAFPPMIGGIETITMELAQRLAVSSQSTSPDAVQVTVVTPRAEGLANEPDLPFRIVRKPDLRQLVRLVRQADVLHLAGPLMLPLFLGWVFRKRMVVEHHGFQTACPNGQFVYLPTQSPCPGYFMAGKYASCLRCNAGHGTIHSIQQWLLTFPRRWLCHAASANVNPTGWLGSVLKLPNMVTIPHGLSKPACKGVAPPRNTTRPVIAFLGRLVSTKGVHVLLESAHQLLDLDFELQIIGDGPERVALEAKANSLGLKSHVKFLGFLDQSGVEVVVSGSMAVVMPSLGGEVFGLAALENMRRGKLVIVSEIGALTEVVGDTGLTFPAGDAKALANRLRRALQPDGFAEKMGSRAITRALSNFTAAQMAECHMALYRLVASSPAA